MVESIHPPPVKDDSQQEKPTLALVALVLSCSFFLTGCIGLLAGIIVGHLALIQCRKRPDKQGMGYAIAVPTEHVAMMHYRFPRECAAVSTKP